MNDTEIARLIGHAFGDGSIHQKHYFIYTNTCDALHQYVKQTVIKNFGNVKYNVNTAISGTPRYQYSNVVGKFLVKRGAPVGSKTMQQTPVPDWIYNGSREVMCSYLSSLFDDEGAFRNEKNANQIVFKAAKMLYLKSDLEVYMSQLTDMLKILGIRTSSIKSDQIKFRQNGEKVVSLRFWITSKDNFEAFKNIILLMHPDKRVKLSDMIKSYRPELQIVKWRRRLTRTHPTVMSEG
jgi:hypothetical protein